MKCPLFVRGHTQAEMKGSILQTECLKEECAWFDWRVGACSIQTLTRNVNVLAAEVVKLRDQMTQDERTRERP